MYKNWINGILGLVVVGVTFMDLTDSMRMWVLVAAGTVVAVTSFWGIMVGQSDQGHRVQGRV